MSKRKVKMNWETKLIKCKMKLDKIALREPRTVEQVKVRMFWERLRIILMWRFARLD